MKYLSDAEKEFRHNVMVERHFIRRYPGVCAILQSPSSIQTVVMLCAMQPLPEMGMNLE